MYGYAGFLQRIYMYSILSSLGGFYPTFSYIPTLAMINPRYSGGNDKEDFDMNITAIIQAAEQQPANILYAQALGLQLCRPFPLLLLASNKNKQFFAQLSPRVSALLKDAEYFATADGRPARIVCHVRKRDYDRKLYENIKAQIKLEWRFLESWRGRDFYAVELLYRDEYRRRDAG